MRVLGLFVLIALTFAGGCERVTAPVIRPPGRVVPGLEVSARRFDTLEWPLAKRRIQLPEPGVLEKLARWLRAPSDSDYRVTAIEVRDATGWTDLWSGVAAKDSVRPPPPFVDFSRDMVYVVVGDPHKAQFPIARIEIDRVYRIESRYSVYANITTARRTDTLRLVDAVVIPALAEGVTLFMGL